MEIYIDLHVFPKLIKPISHNKPLFIGVLMFYICYLKLYTNTIKTYMKLKTTNNID